MTVEELERGRLCSRTPVLDCVALLLSYNTNPLDPAVLAPIPQTPGADWVNCQSPSLIVDIFGSSFPFILPHFLPPSTAFSGPLSFSWRSPRPSNDVLLGNS